MICAAALPRRTPYSHPTSKVLSAANIAAATNIAAAGALAAAADFSDGNLGPDNNNNNNNNGPTPGAARPTPGGRKISNFRFLRKNIWHNRVKLQVLIKRKTTRNSGFARQKGRVMKKTEVCENGPDRIFRKMPGIASPCLGTASRASPGAPGGPIGPRGAQGGPIGGPGGPRGAQGGPWGPWAQAPAALRGAREDRLRWYDISLFDVVQCD